MVAAARVVTFGGAKHRRLTGMLARLLIKVVLEMLEAKLIGVSSWLVSVWLSARYVRFLK